MRRMNMAYRGGSVLAKSRNGSRAFSIASNRAISMSGNPVPENQKRGRILTGGGSVDMYPHSEKATSVHVAIIEAKNENQNWFIPKNKISNVSTKLDNSATDPTSRPSQNLDLKGLRDKPQDEPHFGFDRRKVLFACLFSLLTTQTLFLNVENVLPTYIPDNHKTISPINIACILR